MEENPVVKRLYVGGLGHTISETELQERFGKFGNVTETEIVTRKDEQGKPTKTFAYINIRISEKELKKCISVLNKTKWKGGTLQIELAKESFLHRLARERQEANEKEQKPAANAIINVLESMKKSGVVDFHVKAVPGTEVPNHKDWVVSKFGRVLPVLHLKGQHKNKIIKYDPSKYCHNLKKLDQDYNETVPISQLTWHLEESDKGLSGKRQGQFPVPQKPPKKKMRAQDIGSLRRTELNPSCQFSSDATNTILAKLVQNHTSVSKKQSKEHTESPKPITALACDRNMNSLSESDVDSEEEIRAIIAREKEVHNVNANGESEDNMEIVGDNFELKYATHWSLQRACDPKKVRNVCSGASRTTENKPDYDSADTDEIIAVTKTPNKKKNKTKAVQQGKDRGSKGGILIHATGSESSESKERILDKPKAGRKAVPEKMLDLESDPGKGSISSKCTSGDDEGSSCLDTSGSEGSDNYETVMQNSYRLDLTLEELGRLAAEHMEGTEGDAERNQRDFQCKTKVFLDNSASSIPKASAVTSAPKQCICPEDILSAILEGESSDEDNRKKKKANVKVQPFRGIGSLSAELMKGELDRHGSEGSKASSGPLDVETFKSVSEPWSSKTSCKKLNSKLVSSKETYQVNQKVNSGDNPDSSTSSAEDSETESGDGAPVSESEQLGSLKSVSEGGRKDAGINGPGLAQEKNLNSPPKSEEAFLDSTKRASKLDEKEKRLQDNAKRLTALQERQKERELQKKLIQGALTNLENQSTNKQKHIVFDSGSENEADVEEVIEVSSGSLGKEFATKTSGKLFGSSEDESDTSDEEEDRFKIKPQFEGKAGEKLMRLQSRFGTDERFRMDARFLENDSEQADESKNLKVDEEEELALEKKKNLEILKNLLHIDVEPPKPSKLPSNAKKFKDMNALRYDPTRQDHVVFEKKPENTEKESKAKKKKKREEAQKLPEVSEEIFYEVAVDLKEVFGSTKQEEKKEIISWDTCDDTEQTTLADTETLTAGNNTPERSSGFTFSFFGAEENRSPVKEEPYVIEKIKPSKVVWQEDPRFQDSSSEDDEPEIVQSEAVKEDVKEKSLLQLHPSVRFFFFSHDDERLKEGPKLFYKSSNLDEDRDDWESRRQVLLEDCRKKHKDARRKVKAK